MRSDFFTVRQRAKTLELSVNRRGLPAFAARRCTPGRKQLGTRVGSSYAWNLTYYYRHSRMLYSSSKQLGTWEISGLV